MKKKQPPMSPPEEKTCDLRPSLDATWDIRGQRGFGYIKINNKTGAMLSAYGEYFGANSVSLSAEDVECLIEKLQQALAQMRVWEAS